MVPLVYLNFHVPIISCILRNRFYCHVACSTADGDRLNQSYKKNIYGYSIHIYKLEKTCWGRNSMIASS